MGIKQLRTMQQKNGAFVWLHLFYFDALGDTSCGVGTRWQQDMSLASRGNEGLHHCDVVSVIKDK